MQDDGSLKSRFESLSKGAYLDVILPRAADFDATGLIRDGSSEELARAPSRKNLFFDEKVSVYLVFRTPSSEDDVRELLSNLEVTLGAHATDTAPQASGNAPSATAKHDLTSHTFPGAEQAEVVPNGEHTYIVWKPMLHLTRPRARLQKPAVYFTASVSLAAKVSTETKSDEKEYLAAFEPLPNNVLDPLNFSQGFKGKHLHLSEDRITKVAPKAPRKDDAVKPIRGASKRAFPTLPALFTRMRYNALPNELIASLHIETSNAIAGTFDVYSIKLDLPDVNSEIDKIVAEDMAREGLEPPPKSDPPIRCLVDASMPLKLQAGDEMVLLYSVDTKSHPKPTISVAISATAMLEQGSEIELAISWQSQVDVKTGHTEPLYTWSWPARTTSTTQARQSMLSAPISLPASMVQTAQASGTTFFFAAPGTTNMWDDFLLKIKCVNNSDRPRRFAFAPAELKKPNLGAHGQTLRQKPPHTFCHTPDVRAGPLAPGANCDTVMEFRAMTTGVLDFGAISIVDLDTKQSLLVNDLPDVVASEALEGSQPHGRSKFAPELPKRSEEIEADLAAWRARRRKLRQAQLDALDARDAEQSNAQA